MSTSIIIDDQKTGLVLVYDIFTLGYDVFIIGWYLSSSSVELFLSPLVTYSIKEE